MWLGLELSYDIHPLKLAFIESWHGVITHTGVRLCHKKRASCQVSAQEDTSPRFIDRVSGQGVAPLLGLGFPGRIRGHRPVAGIQRGIDHMRPDQVFDELGAS